MMMVMIHEMPALLLRIPSSQQQGVRLQKHLVTCNNPPPDSRKASLQTTTRTNSGVSLLPCTRGRQRPPHHGYMRILASTTRRAMAIQSAAEQSSVAMPTRLGFSAPAITATNATGGEDSVVVIMGATGTGKSKLSIDIATRFPSEVVNADKIQVYHGLDVTTNKMPVPERQGVAHHLLGNVDPSTGELSAAGFRSLAASRISSIHSRRRLPVIAGGSNSFIHALLADRFDAGQDPFAGPLALRAWEMRGLRYRCCFLWVDVSPVVLNEHLDRRVDEMLGAGMFEELAEHYDPGRRRRGYEGLEKAIGVPEFDRYFENHPPGRRSVGEAAYEEAVDEIKRNTRRLAERQVEKIKRLARMGWGLRRVDATEAVRLRPEGRREAVEEAWERDVMGPSLAAVKGFLDGLEEEQEMDVAVGRVHLC